MSECQAGNPEPDRIAQVQRLTAALVLQVARGNCATVEALARAEFRDDPALAVEVAHSLAELACTIHSGLCQGGDAHNTEQWAVELVALVNGQQ